MQGVALRAAIREVLQGFLDLGRYQVFIFGSEAGGIGTSRSDIDVGILGPTRVPGATMQRIRAELEKLRTLRVFDVVDFARVDKSFRTIAMQNVERL